MTLQYGWERPCIREGFENSLFKASNAAFNEIFLALLQCQMKTSVCELFLELRLLLKAICVISLEIYNLLSKLEWEHNQYYRTIKHVRRES